MSDQFLTIQERIEGILILMKATKNSGNRMELLRDLRELLNDADQILLQKDAAQPPLQMIPEILNDD